MGNAQIFYIFRIKIEHSLQICTYLIREHVKKPEMQVFFLLKIDFFLEYSETIIFCEIFARVSVKKMDISKNIFLKRIFPLEPLEVLFL